MANKDALKKIYEGSYKKRRFSTGGSSYNDYLSYASMPSDASYMSYDPSTMSAVQQPAWNPAISFDPTLTPAPTLADNVGASSYPTGAINLPPPVTASAQSSGPSSWLNSALKSIGLAGPNASQNIRALSLLGSLAGAYGQYKNNKANTPQFNPPPLFGGANGSGGGNTAGQWGPPGGYGYQNYAGIRPGAPGIGYAPRQLTTAIGALPAYYTYGNGPEKNNFTTKPPGMKAGGPVKRFDCGGPTGQYTAQGPTYGPTPGAPPRPASTQTPLPPAGIGQPMGSFAQLGSQMGLPPRPQMPPRPQIPRPQIGFRGPMRAMAGGGMASSDFPVATSPMMSGGGALSSVSRHVKGPGDGTSDGIPARLANGEYVVDAQTVSMLGNGDNGSGAKKLDEMRANIRKHKGSALAKGKMAPDAKPIDSYMQGGKSK